MFPGMGGGGRGMNPKRLQAMMRQMGIEMDDLDDVEEVVIRLADKEIVLTNATVSRVSQAGQVSWQVVGDAAERPRAKAGAAPAPAADEGPLFTDDDVNLVAEQANVSRDKARKALEEADGEPAEAILKLMEE